jgi:pilus assembly protein Flp/PilA
MIRLYLTLEALRRRLGREEGQGLAEYALLLGLIAMIAIVALAFLGSSVVKLLTELRSPL